MILDSEEQKQNLLSLLAIVPFNGNISQGVDRMIMEVKNLMEVIKQAKVDDTIYSKKA
jgi:hypothetical protein